MRLGTFAFLPAAMGSLPGCGAGISRSSGKPRDKSVLRRIGPTISLLSLLLAAGPAHAEVRFAILVGANAGWTNDRPLRHAESDAERVQSALIEVGGFSAERVVLLRDPDTAELRAQLRRLSDRVRGAGDDAFVVFYYSGHADAEQLHLRGL